MQRATLFAVIILVSLGTFTGCLPESPTGVRYVYVNRTPVQPPVQPYSFIRWKVRVITPFTRGFLAFYDNTVHNRLKWGPYFVRYSRYNTVIKIRCRRGHKICYGGWRYLNRYWGCGKHCRKACRNCCKTCNGQTYRLRLWRRFMRRYY